jgi:hypothetical protein
VNFAIHGMKYSQAPDANVPDLTVLVDLLGAHNQQHGTGTTSMIAGVDGTGVDNICLRLPEFRVRHDR